MERTAHLFIQSAAAVVENVVDVCGVCSRARSAGENVLLVEYEANNLSKQDA